MDMGKFLLVLLFLISVGHIGKATEQKSSNPLARGWNDAIDWVDLEQGMELAKKEKKPIMLIIHKTWCGACQRLKEKFSKAKMITELAKNIIMVNAEDDEEPWEEEYYPDGGKYVPRILFLSPDGEVLKDIVNENGEYKEYPYYYMSQTAIIHSMQKILRRYGLPVPGEKGNAKMESRQDNSATQKKTQQSSESETVQGDRKKEQNISKDTVDKQGHDKSVSTESVASESSNKPEKEL